MATTVICLLLAILFVSPGAGINGHEDAKREDANVSGAAAEGEGAQASAPSVPSGGGVRSPGVAAFGGEDDIALRSAAVEGPRSPLDDAGSSRVSGISGGSGMSRAGADVHPWSWRADNDIQKNVQVNIEFQVNNSGTGVTDNTVTVDWEVINYFDKVIHTDSKTVPGSIDAGLHKNVTFTWTPQEATYSTFIWTITMTGDTDTSNNVWQHYQWVYIMRDLANLDVQTDDWSLVEDPWHITDTVDGDDQPAPGSPANTNSDYHSVPEAWHCGTNGTVDTYPTNMDASLVTIEMDFDDYWYNTQDHIWDGSAWSWSNNKCDTPVEHAWLMFSWMGEMTDGANPNDPNDYCNITIVEVATGNEYLFYGNNGGDVNGWSGYYTDCNDNDDFDPDSDIFAINLDAFIEMGGVWKFSFNCHSDAIPDPGKSGYYFDDFAFLGIEANPIVKDCWVWKVGEVGLTEPGKVKTMDVWVRNSAVEVATDVPVKLEVDGSVVDTKTVGSVSPDSDQKVTMEWSPSTSGKHEVRVYSQLPDDEVPENDGESFVVYAYETPESIDDDTDVLVVDNDHGENNSGFWSDSDFFFLDAFGEYVTMDDASHTKFNVWLTTPGYGEPHNGPDDSVMADYEYVFWLTGFAYGREFKLIDGTTYRQDTFTADDINNCKSYLTGGGGDEQRTLIVVGQGVLFDLEGVVDGDDWNLVEVNDYTTSTGTFQHDYLHVAQWTSASGSADPLEPHLDAGGEPDCPVTEDLPDMDTTHIPFGRFTGGPGTDIAPTMTPHYDSLGDSYLMFQGENVTGEDAYNAIMYESDLFTAYYLAFELGCIVDVEDQARLVWNILESDTEEGLGVDIDGGGDALPGETLEFDITMDNIGRKDDLADLEIVLLLDGSPVNWYTDWGVGKRLNDLSISGEGSARTSLNVSLPSDWEDETVEAGSVIAVNLTMTSSNSGLKYYDEGYITVLPVTGKLQMEVTNDQTVSAGKSGKFDVTLRYLTNGADELTVDLAVSGPGKEFVELDEDKITLPPYRASQSGTEGGLRATFTAGEHQHAGDYGFTITASGTDPDAGVTDRDYENSTTSVATVRQFHRVDLAAPEDAELDIVLDPNDVELDVDGNVIRWFVMELRNLGNGPDTIELEGDVTEVWDVYVLAEEPDSGDTEDDIADAAMESLEVDAAPEEEPGSRADDDDDEEEGPYTSAEVWLAVVIPGEDLADLPSGEQVELVLSATSEDGDQEAELSAFITVLKPDATWNERDGEIRLNVSIPGGFTEESGDRITAGPGTQLVMKLEITNPGDSNATGVTVRLNITDAAGASVATIDDEVTTLDMGDVVNASFIWTTPDVEEDAEFTLTFTIDPDGTVQEEDEADYSNVLEKSLLVDYTPPPPPPEEDPTGGSNAALYAGIGAVIAVIAVLALLMLLRKRKKPRPEDDLGPDDMYDEGGYGAGDAPAGGVAFKGEPVALEGEKRQGLGAQDAAMLDEDKPVGLLPPKAGG